MNALLASTKLNLPSAMILVVLFAIIFTVVMLFVAYRACGWLGVLLTLCLGIIGLLVALIIGHNDAQRRGAQRHYHYDRSPRAPVSPMVVSATAGVVPAVRRARRRR